MNKLLLTIASVCFAIHIFSQQTNAPNFITDSIDNYIEKALTDWQIPGVAVGIVKDGEIILEKGYGVTEMDTDKKVNEQTLFMIGSNTKAFTGTALALLEYKRKCKLNDKVIQYVPNFKMYDSTLTEKVNLVDIVSHRLGFETFQGDFMYFDSDLTDDEMLETISKVKPIYDFRTKYGYCNAGYFVAGKCIEAITGKKWGTFLDEKIFTPLKMDRTHTAVSDIVNANNKCTPHTYVNHKLSTIPFGGLDLLGPAASISSSIADMNKWTTMLLDSGRYNGVSVIPQNAIDRTRNPESIRGKGRHMFNKVNYRLYGLGWNLSDYEKYKIVAHTGGIHGFVTSVTLVPEINLGVVVLTNTDQNWFYDALNAEIVDAYMGLPYRNYSNTYVNIFNNGTKKDSIQLAVLHDSIAMNIKPTIALKEFVGTYSNEMYGTIEIKLNDNLLRLSFKHHPDLSAKLDYLGNDRFLCTYSNPSQGIRIFPFTIQDKVVESFILSVASFLEFTTYKFVKVE